MGSIQQPQASTQEQNQSVNSLVSQLAQIANRGQISQMQSPLSPQGMGNTKGPQSQGPILSGGYAMDPNTFNFPVQNPNNGRQYNFEGGIGMKDPMPNHPLAPHNGYAFNGIDQNTGQRRYVPVPFKNPISARGSI